MDNIDDIFGGSYCTSKIYHIYIQKHKWVEVESTIQVNLIRRTYRALYLKTNTKTYKKKPKIKNKHAMQIQHK